jgi:hypothetical protein
MIANERQAMVAVQRHDPVFNRPKLEVLTSGEYYRVNCPFCTDTRHRLWVHHKFGMDEPWRSNRRMTYLAICYNENCLDDFKNVRELESKLFDHVNRNERQKIRVEEGEKPDDEYRPLDTVPMPGTCKPIINMEDSEAYRYLVDRRFDPKVLHEAFRVSYCLNADDRWPIMTGRLVIPIFMNGKRVGWQGRYLGEANWKFTPKYYGMPGMPKRKMIYNWDNVSQGRLAVLVEGAPAVWATDRDCAGALLGKTLTGPQQSLLRQWAARNDYDCGVVLMLDPDAQDNVQGILPELNQALRGNVVNVVLPDGKDPADLDNEFVWELIYAAAEGKFDIRRYITSVASA